MFFKYNHFFQDLMACFGGRTRIVHVIVVTNSAVQIGLIKMSCSKQSQSQDALLCSQAQL